MSLRKTGIIPVEVDMVPLIDIVSLLLMFLVMVGDMARNASNVKMKLPRADMAVADPPCEGRIVVQLKQENGRLWAVVENRRYELVSDGRNDALIRYLEDLTARRRLANAPQDKDGNLLFPVKLRIPAEAPMNEVERVVMNLAQAKLVYVQYAAMKDDAPTRH
jgi:biopolymer transport protein ExbD